MAKSPRRAYKDLGLRQLQSFCAVCETGGYAAAGRKLLLTTPAIWEQVRALEHYYGVPLLQRRGSGVRPTVAGQRLLEMLHPLLANLDSTREVLRQEEGAVPAQVTFVTNLRVLAEDVSRGLAQFRRRYPLVQLRVFFTQIEEVGPRVASGETDVALVLEPGQAGSSSPALAYEPAGEVDYLLVTPPRHPLLQQRSLSLRAVLDCPLVLASPVAYSRQRIQEILQRYDLLAQLTVAVETSSDEYTLSAVRAGLGVGITVGTGQGHLYRGLGVRSMRRWFGAARVGFLWQRGAHIPLAQKELAQAIQTSLAGRTRDP